MRLQTRKNKCGKCSKFRNSRISCYVFFFWDEMGGGCLLARSPLWSSHSKLLSLGCLKASGSQYKRSTGRNLGDTRYGSPL